VNRRRAITLLGGVAAWPVAASAQQPDRMRRIGVLVGNLPAGDPEWQARGNAFVQGLQERGWCRPLRVFSEERGNYQSQNIRISVFIQESRRKSAQESVLAIHFFPKIFFQPGESSIVYFLMVVSASLQLGFV
jgi:hypothetical protein